MATKFIIVGADGLNAEALGYANSEFVSTSAGAGDAGKPVVLDAGGQIDGSMIDASDIDHGLLTGLLDDDHTIYHRFIKNFPALHPDKQHPYGQVQKR